LIGITTAIFSPSGAYAGIGFAIPVDTVRRYVPELIQYGKLIQPSLGIRSIASNQLGVTGLLIVNVEPQSAADEAGLRPIMPDRYGRIILGDIITKVNGVKVRNSNDLDEILDTLKVGDLVSLTVIREGELTEVDARLKARR
jgi:S1-C subfamily serine protease